METIEKVVVGLVLFVLTSVVAYLFRMRQLYAAAPKLYRHAPISKGGSLCEVIVYNRGNQPEELIQVSLDPDLKAELLASSSTDITLDGSTLKVERLHKRCEVSAMLLVENGILDATKIISVSSKGTKGSVCKRVVDVPPNFAAFFVLFLLIVGFVPGMIYGGKLYDALHAAYVRYQMSATYALGWQDLSKYYESDLQKSYSNQEFPLRLSGRQLDANKKPTLVFDIYNKTALPMTVYADRQEERAIGSPYFSSADVPPMSRGSITTKLAEPTSDSPQAGIRFSLKVGEDFLPDIIFIPTPP